MELRQLEHFVAVAEERHFSRAAERLHIVQSGLSSSIRSLERDLGAELFSRSTRRVELTQAGGALLPEARAALAAADRARDAVAAVEGLVRGTLSIGIMQALGPVDLPGLLGRFHALHPGVELHLRQAATRSLLDEVRDGALDLALVAMPPGGATGVEAMVLADEPMVLACPRGHPLAGSAAVDLRDLREQSFVDFPADWGIRISVDRAFEAAAVGRRVAFELNDVRTLLELVAAGLGVSIVPPWASGYRLPLELIRLRGDGPRWVLAAVTRTGRRPSAAGRALLALLRGDDDAVSAPRSGRGARARPDGTGSSRRGRS